MTKAFPRTIWVYFWLHGHSRHSRNSRHLCRDDRTAPPPQPPVKLREALRTYCVRRRSFPGWEVRGGEGWEVMAIVGSNVVFFWAAWRPTRFLAWQPRIRLQWPGHMTGGLGVDNLRMSMVASWGYSHASSVAEAEGFGPFRPVAPPKKKRRDRKTSVDSKRQALPSIPG